MKLIQIPTNEMPCRASRCNELGIRNLTDKISPSGLTCQRMDRSIAPSTASDRSVPLRFCSATVRVLSKFMRDHFLPCCPEWTAWKMLDILWLFIMVKMGQRWGWFDRTDLLGIFKSNQIFL